MTEYRTSSGYYNRINAFSPSCDRGTSGSIPWKVGSHCNNRGERIDNK